MVSFVMVATTVLLMWVMGAEVAQADGFFDAIMSAGTTFTMWMAALFMKITIFILRFTIQIGGYNGFIDSTAVTTGWVLVRDVTNMFFVIILLVIAFGTILGIEQYEYKKLLVKLLFAAILVNFSRTIAGLIIDLAQVVMITFINGVAATAGGNLINAFNFNDIQRFAGGTQPENYKMSGIFMASVAAVAFAGMAMVTMGVYLVILLARMIVLWVLIILSPLAFVLNVIPQTQKYASQWWTEFGNHVIVGPILAFFLWLSFAVVGSGTVSKEIADPSNNSVPVQITDEGIESAGASNIKVGGQSAGITAAMTWPAMANFAIAIGMLLIGAKVTQALGVTGGAMMGKVTDFGKKVAAVASGYTAARWAAKKGVEGAKKAGIGLAKLTGKGLYQGLLANRVERIKGDLQRSIVEGWRAWRAGGPRLETKEEELNIKSRLSRNEELMGYKMEYDEKSKAWHKVKRDENNKIVDSKDALTEDEQNARVTADESGKLYDENGKAITQMKYDFKKKKNLITDKSGVAVATEEEAKKAAAADIKKGAKLVREGDEWYTEQVVDEGRGPFQRFFHGRHEKLLRSRKQLKRVQEFAKVREELMDKRISADPKYLFQAFEGPSINALDRIEKGMLEAEQARSEEKTTEYKAYGRRAVKGNARFKNGEFQIGEKDKYGLGTVSEQIQAHKARAEAEIGLEEMGAKRNRAAFFQRFRHTVEAKKMGELGGQIAEELIKFIEASVRGGLINTSQGEQYVSALARSKSEQEGLSSEEEKNLLAAQSALNEKGKGKLEAESAPIETRIQSLQGVASALAAGEKAEGMRTGLDSKKSALEEMKREYGVLNNKANPTDDETERGVRLADEIGNLESEIEADENKLKGMESAAGIFSGGANQQKIQELAASLETLTKAMEKIKVGGKIDATAAQAFLSSTKGTALENNFKVLFGKQQMDENFLAKTEINVLQQILGQLRQAGSAANVEEIGKSLSGSLTQSRGQLSAVWGKAGAANPALYAAHQLALRDHQYTLYRGTRQDMISKAGQANIWGNMGIDVPNTAAEEAVVEGFFKNFKDMNYDQLLQAHRGHMNHVTLKGKGKQTWEDKMVAQTILKGLFEQSWIDDATMNMLAQEVATTFGGEAQQVIESVRKTMRASATLLNNEQAAAIKGFLQKYNLGAEAVRHIKEFNVTESSKIELQHRNNAQNDQGLRDQGIKNIQELFKLIRGLDSEQLKKLT